MEHKELIKTYSILTKNNLYPEVAGEILRYMYVSSRKYFTLKELELLTENDKGQIYQAIDLLVKRGEIQYEVSDMSDEQYLFHLDMKGVIQNLKKTLNDHLVFTDLLEEMLDEGNIDNEEMNQFVKSSILFNSEVLEFINHRIKEYFTNNITIS